MDFAGAHSGSVSVGGSGSGLVEQQRPPRHTSSKYDFVKVRVWLGSQQQQQQGEQQQQQHYYVLSRFLVARMLTVTRIPHVEAIKVALELKKQLVDDSRLDVSQDDVEERLFELMARRGYGDDYVRRYRMMTRFYHTRTPLVILICGTACVGKSAVATQLAQRLNLPNVLQTDIVYELLRSTSPALARLDPSLIWTRQFESDADLVAEFQRECAVVRRGLEGDLRKAMRDGKPIIIEGLHLDPASFCRAPTETSLLSTNVGSSSSSSNSSRGGSNSSLVAGLRSSLQPQPQQPSHVRGSATAASGKSQQREDESHGQGEPIVIPVVLRTSEEEQKMVLQQWVDCRQHPDGEQGLNQVPLQELLRRMRVVQDYLCCFQSEGVMVFDSSASSFSSVLESLHALLLECIEAQCEAATDGNEGRGAG